MFIETLRLLGKYHEQHGDYMKGCLFLLAGLEITQQSPALLSSMQVKVEVDLAKVEYRRHRWTECLDHVQHMEQIQRDIDVRRCPQKAWNSIWLLILTGDLWRKQQIDTKQDIETCIEKAQACYTEADELLQQMVDPTLFVNVQQVGVEIILPCQQSSKQKRSIPSSTFMIPHSLSNIQEDVTPETVSIIQCGLAIQQVKLHIMQDSEEDSFNILRDAQQQLGEEVFTIEKVTTYRLIPDIDQAVSHYYMGLLSLRQQGENNAWNISARKTSSSKSKSSSDAHHLGLEHLLSAFAVANQLSCSKWLRKICLELAAVYGRAHSLASSFYINYSLGVTAKNQLVSLCARREVNHESTREEQEDPLIDMFASLSLTESFSRDKTTSRLFGPHSFEDDEGASFQEMVDTLPSCWTVVTLALTNDNRWLLINRLESDANPVVLRIPLECTADEEEEINKLLDIQDKFGTIVETSSEARVETAIPTSEWKKWWDKRKQQDNSLQEVLASMQELFGHWKGMLLGTFVDVSLNTAVKDAVISLKEKIGSKLNKKSKGKKSEEVVIDEDLLRICLQSWPSLSEQDTRDFVAELLDGHSTSKELEEVQGILLSPH